MQIPKTQHPDIPCKASRKPTLFKIRLKSRPKNQAVSTSPGRASACRVLWGCWFKCREIGFYGLKPVYMGFYTLVLQVSQLLDARGGYTLDCSGIELYKNHNGILQLRIQTPRLHDNQAEGLTIYCPSCQGFGLRHQGSGFKIQDIGLCCYMFFCSRDFTLAFLLALCSLQATQNCTQSALEP